MGDKITLVIPHMPSVEGADEALAKLLASVGVEHNLQAAIVTNDGIGYGAAVNMGLEEAFSSLSSPSQVIVSNNDMRLLYGDLSNLLHLHSVVTPAILPQPRDNQPRCFFSVCSTVYKMLMERDGFFYDPLFSEGGGYYWEDDDLIKRLHLYEVPILHEPDVLVEHYGGGGLTAKQLGESYWYEKNKKKFEEKWKRNLT